MSIYPEQTELFVLCVIYSLIPRKGITATFTLIAATPTIATAGKTLRVSARLSESVIAIQPVGTPRRRRSVPGYMQCVHVTMMISE